MPTIVQKHIQVGNTKAALSVLLKQCQHTELENEAIQLSARYERYQKEVRQHTTDQTILNIELNRIHNAILQLAEQHRTKRRPSWQWLAAISVVIGILAGLAELSGYSLRDFFGGSEQEEALTLTIKVRDEEGGRPLKSEGVLVIDYGNGTQTRPIDEEGKVDLREIPSHLEDNEISVVLEEADEYKAIREQRFQLDGQPITFLVAPNQKLGIIKGKVRSRDGKKVLEGVVIEVEGKVTSTDALGNFYMELPPEKWKTEYKLYARKGTQIKEEIYYPNLEDFEIRLEE